MLGLHNKPIRSFNYVQLTMNDIRGGLFSDRTQRDA